MVDTPNRTRTGCRTGPPCPPWPHPPPCRRAVGVGLEQPGHARASAAQMHTHDGDQDGALPHVADHRAERPGQADGDHQQQEDLEAGSPSAFGFSNGCAELALNIPPPLVPSSLIASWEATGRQRNGVRRAVDAGDVHAGAQGHARHRSDEQQDRGRRTRTAAASARRRGSGRPRSCRADRSPARTKPRINATATAMPDGRRDEVLHGQPGHLHGVAEHRLRDVGLPVRVRHERDGGVERHRRHGRWRRRRACRGRRPAAAAAAAVAAGRAARTETNEKPSTPAA